MFRLSRGWIGLLLSGACRTTHAAADEPARIVRPTPQSHDQLVSAVSSALGGASVTLRDDALVQESSLSIERLPRRDPAGNLAQGRITEMPERFSLVRSGEKCFLIHQRTGKRIELPGVECATGVDAGP
jgi:hypothetical protein